MADRRKKSFRTARRFFCALSTLRHFMGWGGRKFGFYIPYQWAGSLESFGEGDTYHWLKKVWNSDQTAFLASLQIVEKYLSRLSEFATGDPAAPDRPRFDQSWCPGLDGCAAYSFVRELQPANIIEIGSGHSTRFMAQAIKDGGLETHLLSIDPQPRRGIDHLCDEVIRTTLDKADLSLFASLEAGDILYFDGSHISMPGSDADILINQILPTLNPGVRVHIHDIFLPYGYPKVWEWRGYNEQNLVAALLGGGVRFTPLFASHYIRTHMTEKIAHWPIPLPRECFETSLWLRVN